MKLMAITILVEVPDDETKEDVAHTFHHTLWTMPSDEYKFHGLDAVGEHEARKRKRRDYRTMQSPACPGGCGCAEDLCVCPQRPAHARED